MCETYVPAVGYVCRDCQREFKTYLSLQKDVFLDSRMSIEKALESFMETRSEDFATKEIDVDEFFHSYARD